MVPSCRSPGPAAQSTLVADLGDAVSLTIADLHGYVLFRFDSIRPSPRRSPGSGADYWSDRVFNCREFWLPSAPQCRGVPWWINRLLPGAPVPVVAGR